MAKRLAELKQAAPFVISLYPAPKTLEGTRVKIRPPKIFTQSYTLDSPHPVDGEKISPLRVQPPFMTMKPLGLSLTFEAFELDADKLKVPYYCYLAVGPAKQLGPAIADKLKKDFPDAKPDWEPAVVKSPGGDEIAWQKIRVEAEQDFEVQKPFQPKSEPVKLPGVFELWMYETPDYLVFVGWRIPNSIEEKVHLLELAPLTAGTIVIDPPPAEAPAEAPPAAAPPA